jgi:predicted DNA-binding protein with PD1-like motif
MQSHEASLQRVILIRVDPREDLLDALERAVTEQSVPNGSSSPAPVRFRGTGSMS